MAYTEVKGSEQKESAVAFLLSAPRYYRRSGIRIQAVMIDNAKVFRSGRFQKVLLGLGLVHKTTPPYRPSTNRKVECFIRTLFERMGVRPRSRQLRCA